MNRTEFSVLHKKNDRSIKSTVASWIRCEADAKLIAAAPDLLEFAQQVAQVAKNHGNLFIQVWAESVCKNAGFPVVLKDEPDFVAGGAK
jgi:hypothetical protein